MLISRTHKFIFIKTRKVGGTSLEKYIVDNHFSESQGDVVTGSRVDNLPWINCAEGTRGHMGWSEISHLLPADDYKIFTLDRNPWDKCVSQYFFFRDKIKTRPNDTFSEFLQDPNNLPVDSPRYKDAPVFIIKYETMERDLPLYFDLFDVKFDIDKFKEYNLKSGIRKDKHYSEMYSDRDVEIVADAFKWEIENLKYEFEDRR